MTDALRYPIGSFDRALSNAPAARIAEIAALPTELRAAVADITPDELRRSYRDGAWTVQQLVHHIADSHLNGYVRHKLALTESVPTICPYDERLWSDLADVTSVPIGVSLSLIDALHARWVVALAAMQPSDLARTYVHPEHGREFSIAESIANYAWHGRHHTAHIRLARGARP